MKIGVISDTHFNNDKYLLPTAIKKAFKKVDLIIHAGDITHPSVIRELEKIAPVKIVKGNKNGDCHNFSNLPKEMAVSLNQFSFIIVVHCPCNRIKKEVSHLASLLGLQKLSDGLLLHELSSFLVKHSEAEGIIFGDTHKPFCRKINGKYFLNPGAAYATQKRPGSVLVMEVDEQKSIVVNYTYFFTD